MLNHIDAIKKQKEKRKQRNKKWRNNVSGQKRETEKEQDKSSHVLTVITAHRKLWIDCYQWWDVKVYLFFPDLVSFSSSFRRTSEIQTCGNWASVHWQRSIFSLVEQVELKIDINYRHITRCSTRPGSLAELICSKSCSQELRNTLKCYQTEQVVF